MILGISQEERDFRETGKNNTSNIFYVATWKLNLEAKPVWIYTLHHFCKGESPFWNCAEEPQKMEAALWRIPVHHISFQTWEHPELPEEPTVGYWALLWRACKLFTALPHGQSHTSCSGEERLPWPSCREFRGGRHLPMGMSSDPPLMMQLEAWHVSLRVTLDGLPPAEGCVVPAPRAGCWECP